MIWGTWHKNLLSLGVLSLKNVGATRWTSNYALRRVAQRDQHINSLRVPTSDTGSTHIDQAHWSILVSEAFYQVFQIGSLNFYGTVPADISQSVRKVCWNCQLDNNNLLDNSSTLLALHSPVEQLLIIQHIIQQGRGGDFFNGLVLLYYTLAFSSRAGLSELF